MKINYICSKFSSKVFFFSFHYLGDFYIVVACFQRFKYSSEIHYVKTLFLDFTEFFNIKQNKTYVINIEYCELYLSFSCDKSISNLTI